jgi:hypothetical protein
MKKTLLILLSLLITATFVSAQTSERYVFSGKFHLDIYRDGELTQDKIIATALVSNWRKEGKGDGVTWNQVYLRRMDKVKSVKLEPNKYISELGQIKNLVMDDDSVSFDLIIKQGSGVQKMKISLTKSFPGLLFSALIDIKATGYYYKGNVAQYKVEWKESSKDQFVLP